MSSGALEHPEKVIEADESKAEEAPSSSHRDSLDPPSIQATLARIEAGVEETRQRLVEERLGITPTEPAPSVVRDEKRLRELQQQPAAAEMGPDMASENMPQTTGSKDYYKAFEGKDKEKRRQLVSARLEKRRFLLPDSPEWKRRIKEFKRAVEIIKGKHPEIISFSLFGSATKGYAVESSDLDLYVHVDEGRFKQNVSGDPAKNIDLYQDIIRAELAKIMDLDEKKLEYVKVNLLDKDVIRRECLRKNGLTFWRMFLFTPGAEVDEYRRTLLDTLDEIDRGEGPLLKGWGDAQWRGLIANLMNIENSGLDPALIEKRKALYPQTLAAARAYFLHEKAGSANGQNATTETQEVEDLEGDEELG